MFDALNESVEDSGVTKYACAIQKLSFDTKLSEFRIQNTFDSCDVKFPTRLVGLAYGQKFVPSERSTFDIFDI